MSRTSIERTRERSSGQSEKRYEEVFAQHCERVAYELLHEEMPLGHAWRDVAVRATARTLSLTGRVPSFYLKALLQSRLGRAFPDLEIENRVAVVDARGFGEPAAGED